MKYNMYNAPYWYLDDRYKKQPLQIRTPTKLNYLTIKQREFKNLLYVSPTKDTLKTLYTEITYQHLLNTEKLTNDQTLDEISFSKIDWKWTEAFIFFFAKPHERLEYIEILLQFHRPKLSYLNHLQTIHESAKAIHYKMSAKAGTLITDEDFIPYWDAAVDALNDTFPTKKAEQAKPERPNKLIFLRDN